MSRPLPPEVELAAACCAWPPSPRVDGAVRLAAERVGDWTRFDAVVSRNRVAPLVHRALSRTQVTVPETVEQAISARAAAAGRQALVMARETVRLQRAFDDAAIPFMVLKGTPLAVLAYGDLGAKESRDIDTVVSPGDAARAVGLLVELGYDGTLARLQGDRVDGYIARIKEATFSRAGLPFVTELHWRLLDHSSMLPGVGVRGPAQDVAVPGGRIRTLADGELFAYLCAHGAHHNWGRLKWLADIGALLGSRSPAEIEQLYEAAQRHGVVRPAAVALLLCRRLLGLDLGDRLQDGINRDRICRLLADNALAGLAYRGGGAEHALYTTAWMRTVAAPFLIAPGAAHLIENARLVWNMPIDRVAVDLPRRLWFLYHVLRVPSWMLRFGRRMVQRAAG